MRQEVQAMHEITDKDNGRKLSVAVGERFRVTLAATPSTGYRWQPLEDPGPTLRLEDGPDLQPGGSVASTRPGAPTSVSWQFSGVRAGTGTITLIYVRPWEKGAEPARRFSVEVEVR
jgi:inhibitor of cysteine peptidase